MQIYLTVHCCSIKQKRRWINDKTGINNIVRSWCLHFQFEEKSHITSLCRTFQVCRKNETGFGKVSNLLVLIIIKQSFIYHIHIDTRYNCPWPLRRCRCDIALNMCRYYYKFDLDFCKRFISLWLCDKCVSCSFNST